MTRRTPRTGGRSCPICRKPLGKAPTAKARSGKACHTACPEQVGAGQSPREWDVAAAEREFARNKARIESGSTFRGRQSTGWRLGGSPSTAGEIKR